MSFAHPAWLLLLPLLPLLGVLTVWIARRRGRRWATLVSPRLRASLLRAGNPYPRWFGTCFLLAGCAAMLGALARPQGLSGTRQEKSLGRNLLFALDLSRSMMTPDVTPNRLAQAKMIVQEIIDACPTDRIGLIGFAGDAHVFAPLTVDHPAVRETISQIDPDWAPFGGSNLAKALRLAIDTLRKTGQKQNTLVVLSDGEENDGSLREVIDSAESAGVFVVAIAVGTEDGGYVPHPTAKQGRLLDRSGKPVLSRVQPETLRELANGTGGRFALASSRADFVGITRSVLSGREQFELEGRQTRVTTEFYQWLLFPGLIFIGLAIFLNTRWRSVAAPASLVLLAGTATLIRPAQASEPDASLRSSQAILPSQRDRLRYADGESALRRGDWPTARSAFSDALRAKDATTRRAAHLALGSGLFEKGWKSLGAPPLNEVGEALKPDADPAQLDQWLRACIKASRKADSAEQGFNTLKTLTSDWSDAIRHLDSALALSPADAPARENRAAALHCYKRLLELLQEEEKNLNQMMPPPQSSPQGGQCPRSNPDQESGDSKEQSQPEQSKNSGDSNPSESDPQNGGPNADNQKPPSQPSDPKDQEQKPGESPQQRARRVLADNADLEKGPVAPGRIFFREPENDW